MFLSLEILLLIFTVVANTILAFAVYRSNTKSATNRIFGILNFFISIWMIVFYYDFLSPSLLAARLSIFIATPMNLIFFLFAYTLPDEEWKMKRKWLYSSLAAVAAVMAIDISPLAIRDVAGAAAGAATTQATVWMIPFGILSVFFTYLVGHFLIMRYRSSKGPAERSQIRLVMMGMLIMMVLLITTVLLPILIANDSGFFALVPIYALIFLGMTAYAIVRHGLFDVKVIATEALTVILWLALFAQIWVSSSSSVAISNVVVFAASVVLGMFLIQSVRREVKQREVVERLAKELETTNHKLEDLSRFKSELLSLASHQIRSPLAAIKGFIALILTGAYGPADDKVKDTLKKVQTSADDLIGLINTLLDVRKVEEGKMEYQFAKTDLVKIVDDVFESLRPLAWHKQLDFTYDAPKAELFVNADAQKLKQVIQNLMDNAIKYTPSGYVRALLKEDDGKATLTVSDSGVGIPATLIPYLFEEFVRDARVKQEIRGTGLGLYIARKITEAHGGKIWAESTGEGKGSVFGMSMPTVK